MPRTIEKKLVELEQSFWQSMVEQNTDAALAVLHEPAVMVSAHGAMRFDHEGYRKMAERGPMVVTGFEFSDMQVVQPTEDTAILTYRVKQSLSKRGQPERFEEEMVDSSTWVKIRDAWKCVIHTEAPLQRKPS